jgi:hypothetical protein
MAKNLYSSEKEKKADFSFSEKKIEKSRHGWHCCGKICGSKWYML